MSKPAVASERAIGVEAWLPHGQPDWEAIDFDLPCSRCGYELRGLPEPRCPECGLTFAWPDILEARLHRSQFLFEHHWRQRPVWSWIRTTAAGLRPWRFWRRVSLHDHVHGGPLIVMFLLSGVVSILVVQLAAAALWLAATGVAEIIRSAGYVYVDPGLLVSLLRDVWGAVAWTPISFPMVYVGILAALGLYGLAAAALLCGLRQTLGRCHVRTAQVFRVLAYSATPVCLVWGFCILLLPVLTLLLDSLYMFMAMTVVLTIAAWVLPHVIFTLYVGYGLRYYLRLPRAWLLAATASIVGQLFAFTAMLAGMRELGF